jgi:hypothetical protein
MNSVREKVRKSIFGKLRSLRKKLNSQGVPCCYSRSVLSHENGGTGFKITCDASLLAQISINTGDGIEEFTNVEQGLARVQELFGR